MEVVQITIEGKMGTTKANLVEIIKAVREIEKECNVTCTLNLNFGSISN